MDKKILSSGFLFVLLLFTFSLSEVQKLRFNIAKLDGNVKFWNRSGNINWNNVDKNTALVDNSTFKVLEKSDLRLNFEPAISVCIMENSVATLDNAVMNTDLKAIRLNFKLKKGKMDVKVFDILKNKLFFSINTGSSVIQIRKAMINISVSDDGVTTVDVNKGNVRIENVFSGLKTVVYSGSRAVIRNDDEQISITKLGKELKVNYGSGIPETSNDVPSIAMLSIQSSVISKGDLASISDMVAEQIQTKLKTSIMYLDDVKAMLESEGMGALLNCYTDSCISRIGSYLGVDKVVIGRVGKVGNRYLFNLKMTDVLRDKTISRLNVSVENDPGLIVDELPSAVSKLVHTSSAQNSGQSLENDMVSNLIRSTKPSLAEIKSTSRMVWIYPGKFLMGSHNGISGRPDETPAHNVEVAGFYMDKYEVSKYEFKLVMGYLPSSFKGCDECPIDNITWKEANDYCKKVGKRLPTEAEWEYACRTGTKTEFGIGNTISSNDANFNGKKPYGGAPAGVFKSKPVPVGLYKPNNWKLFDMNGNVSEWCSDYYNSAYYGTSPEVSPKGPSSGKFKVVRGGSWIDPGENLRCANRSSYNPDIRLNTIGFRCVSDYKKK